MLLFFRISEVRSVNAQRVNLPPPLYPPSSAGYHPSMPKILSTMYAARSQTVEQTSALIETAFPLQKVSAESVREKNIRHGHISTLHIWWSRKPLAASRASILAALLPDDPATRHEHLKLIEQLAPWEAVANGGSTSLLQRARALIRAAFGGRAPRVLDPFAGGGSIPLEAMRLGCETYALDYNPVAVLLNRCILEYPTRFGAPDSVPSVPLPPRDDSTPSPLLEDAPTRSPLLLAVQAWGDWVLRQARKQLAPTRFYPPDPDGSIPVGYYWMRTIPCQNPTCGAEIPLTANWWLAKKDKRQIALKIVPDHAHKRVEFEIVGQAGDVGAHGGAPWDTAVRPRWDSTPSAARWRGRMWSARCAGASSTTRPPAACSKRARRDSAWSPWCCTTHSKRANATDWQPSATWKPTAPPNRNCCASVPACAKSGGWNLCPMNRYHPLVRLVSVFNGTICIAGATCSTRGSSWRW
jgi:hypothetical protein